MNKEEIQKMFKENPIKTIKCGDIEIPVEWLRQTTVNINGDDYIKLQQENKQLKEELKAVNKGLRKVLSKRKKWKYRYYKEKMKNRRAKSYIKNNYHLNWYIESNYKDELLQILDKGESNE